MRCATQFEPSGRWNEESLSLRGFFTGAPDRIDSDRLKAIFTPLGRLRRLKRWRVLSNNVRLLGRDTPVNKNGLTRGPFSFTGAPDRIRTCDPCLRSTLFRL